MKFTPITVNFKKDPTKNFEIEVSNMLVNDLDTFSTIVDKFLESMSNQTKVVVADPTFSPYENPTDPDVSYIQIYNLYSIPIRLPEIIANAHYGDIYEEDYIVVVHGPENVLETLLRSDLFKYAKRDKQERS